MLFEARFPFHFGFKGDPKGKKHHFCGRSPQGLSLRFWEAASTWAPTYNRDLPKSGDDFCNPFWNGFPLNTNNRSTISPFQGMFWEPLFGAETTGHQPWGSKPTGGFARTILAQPKKEYTPSKRQAPIAKRRAMERHKFRMARTP